MVDIQSFVNPTLAVILWAIGIAIKHTKVFEKIKNNFIPVILSVLGIIINLFMSGVSLQSVIVGFVTSMVCVGIHKSGNETLKGIDLSSIFTNESSSEEPVIEDTEVSVEDEIDEENG